MEMLIVMLILGNVTGAVAIGALWISRNEAREESARLRKRGRRIELGRDRLLDLAIDLNRKVQHEMAGRAMMAQRVETLNRGKVAAERSLVIALQALIEREALIANLSDEVGWGHQHLADAIDRLSGRRPIVDIELPTGE
jgi:hypothetical protein